MVGAKFGAVECEIENIDGALAFGVDQGYLQIAAVLG
jgi:hypothetical protein